MANLPKKFDGEITTHLCTGCEKQLTMAKVQIVTACGMVVAFTPILYMVLTFAMALIRHELWSQEKILISMLITFGTIMAFAFPKDRKKDV